MRVVLISLWSCKPKFDYALLDALVAEHMAFEGEHDAVEQLHANLESEHKTLLEAHAAMEEKDSARAALEAKHST